MDGCRERAEKNPVHSSWYSVIMGGEQVDHSRDKHQSAEWGQIDMSVKIYEHNEKTEPEGKPAVLGHLIISRYHMGDQPQEQNP